MLSYFYLAVFASSPGEGGEGGEGEVGPRFIGNVYIEVDSRSFWSVITTHFLNFTWYNTVLNNGLDQSPAKQG